MNQCFTYSVSPSFPFFAEIHTFSAKEKDSETGLSYFGSRYYSSDLSIWMSVDPMSDKYPHQSNYVYCSNNPIRLVDPNGEDEWEVDKKGNITWKCESEKHQFKFVADNSDVEWEFEYSKEDGRSQYSLVTDGFSGQVTSHFGSKAITSIHSHPKEPNNYQSEVNSLYGDRGYSNLYPRTNMYVYMPKLQKLKRRVFVLSNRCGRK